ncbi:MAG: carboxypeptidase-like regulatory domain-containing protein, partial [Phaeodactylibacter sp.]|nr:carboxypeptidase-like regulatory domain-containing protein [Phaeodactylibacter sp.]
MKFTQLFALFGLLWPCLNYAQVYGTVTDVYGEALPFANIYLKGTSTGTAANIEGVYELQLEPGSYEIVFQYIGYETKIL